MLEMIKPSDVTKVLIDTPWKNLERETIATNILVMSRHGNGDEWRPFTWDEYVEFCSHTPTRGEAAILDEFAETGYLSKDADGVYRFERKIIGVYMQYTD